MQYPLLNRHRYPDRIDHFLDANESKFSNKVLNLYPEPFQPGLQKELSQYLLNNWFHINPECIFPTIWAEGAIENLIKWSDKMKLKPIVCPPSFILYEHYIKEQWLWLIEVPLSKEWQLQINLFQEFKNPYEYIIFISSPWNPTGKVIDKSSIILLLEMWFYVLIDEAYIHFSWFKESLLYLIKKFKKLFIIQSFSKWFWVPWLRLWYIVCNNKNLLIDSVNPYQISNIVSEIWKKLLTKTTRNQEKIKSIIINRDKLWKELAKLYFIDTVINTETNFVLFKPKVAYRSSLLKHIRTYNISILDLWFSKWKVYLKWFIRITIGNRMENNILLKCLNEYKK